MIFILYSDIDESSIKHSLGKPEYSYYFVLREFRTVLEQLGTVITITEPETRVDELYHKYRAEGEECVYISFSPPHKSLVDLSCPTLCVVAWEFSNIPNETWNEEPRNDWRYVFDKHGWCITLSRYTEQAVKDAMGEEFPVMAIPTPTWDRFEPARSYIASIIDHTSTTTLSFEGSVIDSRAFDLSAASYTVSGSNRSAKANTALGGLWQGKDIELNFTYTDQSISLLDGFFSAEHWGTWSRTSKPSIQIPFVINQPVNVTIEAIGFGANIDRDITVSLGKQTTTMKLTNSLQSSTLYFNLDEPTDRLSFSDLDLTPRPGAEDRRTLAIGISKVTIKRVSPADCPAPEDLESTPTTTIDLDGIIYTSVLNPSDGRKNWVDMITAFCYAFRDTEDATLILKMTNTDLSTFLGKFNLLLTQLYPFKCRVIALHGFLNNKEYEKLVATTTYYVNTSHCEGLCLPLMEYMCCGRPAIAPAHTAMKDYVDESVAFTVRSSVEQNVWPQDTRDVFRTLSYRIDWESLLNAYKASYQLAKHEPEQYQAMSERTVEKLKNYCSQHVVKNKLEEFFNLSKDNKAKLASETKHA